MSRLEKYQTSLGFRRLAVGGIGNFDSGKEEAGQENYRRSRRRISELERAKPHHVLSPSKPVGHGLTQIIPRIDFRLVCKWCC